MVTLELTARLPFSLRVNGASPCRLDGKTVAIRVLSMTRDRPTAPWLGEGSENVFIENDNTDHFGYSEIHIISDFIFPDDEMERAIFFISVVPNYALKIVNSVIQSARFHLRRHELFTLNSPSQLTLLKWRCLSGECGFEEGVSSLFPGVITNTPPSYGDSELNNFAAMIVSGTPLTMSQKLLIDALHYKSLGDNRLAAMHLLISFEAFLHEIISTVEHKVINKPHNWTIGKINDSLGALIGRKLGKDGVPTWGEEACHNWDILTDVRNTLMHKGIDKFTVRHAGEIDLNKVNILESLFSASENLKDNIKSRVALI